MLQKILEEKSHKTPTAQGTVKNKMQKYSKLQGGLGTL
jgi:hypothetical protein